MGEVSPTFDQCEKENQKGKKEESQKKKKKERKNRIEGKKTDKERKKGGEKKMDIFPAFRWSNLDGPRIKVNQRNEGYAWVPKSGSFVKL